MLNHKLKPIAIAVGAAFAGSLASVALADAETDLFAAEELERSYDLVADGHGNDGSCGDGTCGDDDSKEDSGEDSGDSGGDNGGGYNILAQADDSDDEDGDDEDGDDSDDGGDNA